jgi:hypothetical protein
VGSLAAPLALAMASATGASAQVLNELEISDTQGGFTGGLAGGDRFGGAVAGLGDVDGDGVADIAVGAPEDSTDGVFAGTVWIVLLNADGTVKGHVEIANGSGGLPPVLGAGDFFGSGVANIGDMDGNGAADLAVGAYTLTTGGAVWILHMSAGAAPGVVLSALEIGQGLGGFGGTIDMFDDFGFSVATLGDVDGDTVVDLAVGAIDDGDGGPGRGAVWILFLDPDGTVLGEQKISHTAGGFLGGLADFDNFGWAVAGIGDLDDDGTPDVAVNSYDDDDGGPARGAIWILFLNPDGTVKDEQKISDTAGGFPATLEDHDHFGSSLAALGDRDGDGVEDLAVGVWQDNDGIGTNVGAVYLLFLETDGTVKAYEKISATSGGFGGVLGDNAWFGSAVATNGDRDGNGVTDLVVGQWGDDDGGTESGAVWLVDLAPPLQAAVSIYGCANPPGSLSVLAGEPALGTTVTLGIDNPLGTQNPGALPIFALALGPSGWPRPARPASSWSASCRRSRSCRWSSVRRGRGRAARRPSRSPCPPTRRSSAGRSSARACSSTRAPASASA